jgi:hypothetical protein
MVEFDNYSENLYTQYSEPVCEAVSFDKMDLKSVPGTFLNIHDVVSSLHYTVSNLEQSLQNQSHIYDAYSSLCNILKNEMYDKLAYKCIKIDFGILNKKRNVSKPWLISNLSRLCFLKSRF